jgi:3-oxoacyl-[acyl-carrier-protein] synthase-3
MILEKTDEERGVIDAIYHINSAEHDNIVFPGCGFSKLFTAQNQNDLKLRWKPFDCPQVPIYVDNMKKLLTRNNLTVDDVKMFCFSQYIIMNVEAFRSLLGIDESKSIFIGNEYGYTGTSSPFIALYESMKRGLVKKGDYILFWTVSAGAQNISLLLKL